MLSITKVFLAALVCHLMLANAQLWADFETVPVPDPSEMYETLSNYASSSQRMFQFDGANMTLDFSTPDWMDDCYREYYTNAKNKYVVFWIIGDTVYCEAVSKLLRKEKLKFPLKSLMRVERIGDRCD